MEKKAGRGSEEGDDEESRINYQQFSWIYDCGSLGAANGDGERKQGVQAAAK